MLDVATSPFASLFGLFVAVPLSIIVGVCIADSLAAAERIVSPRPVRPKLPQAVPAAAAPVLYAGGLDPAPGIVWG